MENRLGHTAPGIGPEMLEDLLQGVVPDRRDGLRAYRFLDLRIEGSQGTFRAVAVDLSRSGMLFRITDPSFATAEEAGQLMPYTARVWSHFDEGLTVHFPDGAAPARAEVVRVTGYCGELHSLILVACRFREPLDPLVCRILGIDGAADLAP